MVFHGFHPFRDPRKRLSLRQRMILQHAHWLGWALRENPPLPRIPVRKVSEGGFARLMSTPAGRYRAERWRERTLARVDTTPED
jgi:hypothetical protein